MKDQYKFDVRTAENKNTGEVAIGLAIVPKGETSAKPQYILRGPEAVDLIEQLKAALIDLDEKAGGLEVLI